ncbi:hypothetical protein [Nocardia sp. NPDC019395]|uniref:hypothetical protein n=1 Tax=Nocardia sp. NPDC019395 TaxID=3154686 RepID=UPI0033FFC2D2
MSDGKITYSSPDMVRLFETLNTEAGNIFREIDAIEGAKNNLLVAMNSEGAASGIAQAHKKLVDEALGDTKVKLNNLAAAVEEALERALGTDKHIGDGFASLG